MLDLNNFKIWLNENTNYSDKTISNIASRVNRANKMISLFPKPIYIFNLEQEQEYQKLSSSIRSQIKKAVNLYIEFEISRNNSVARKKDSSLKALSLFANIGVAEAYLKEIGIDVVLANELVERRAALYSKIYPETNMICGDITKQNTFDDIVFKANEIGIDIVMATPPCQGMSTAGQQNIDDERNKLICQVIDMVKAIMPKYVFLENVPMFFNTSILLKNKRELIPDIIKKELSDLYNVRSYVIDTKDYSVPQTRERAIFLLTRKDMKKQWLLPKKSNHIVTMYDAIGKLPMLDPFITDVDEKELLSIFPKYYERKKQAEEISKWHTPPHHIKRQVIAMQHTPTGKTAFDNDFYYPKKENGEPVKGYRNTYKRQNWNTPAYTVTMDNRKISSQNNVHPGRLEYIDENGENIYSDARTLTLYEIMKIMSLPDDWNVPANTSEAFLRRIIGEGIPPLFVKKVFASLTKENCDD